jgi:hypothetical protein
LPDNCEIIIEDEEEFHSGKIVGRQAPNYLYKNDSEKVSIELSDLEDKN